MRDYAKVGPKFWIGKTGKKLRAAGPIAQVVGMYLMTSPHANMLGLYHLPIDYIAIDTGLGEEGAYKGLQSCIDAGYCVYDEETEMVWVFEMALYQIGEELTGKDLRIKGVQNEYNSLPDNPFLQAFFEKYAAPFCMEKGRGNSSNEAPSKPLASQEQEQAHEQEQSRSKSKPAAQPAVALPDWIPMASWNGYIEMRKKKRKEPTARAIELLVAELEKLRAVGQDIAAVLDKSTVNGWTDVYPLKGDNQARASPAGPHRLGKAGQATAAAAQRLLERMEHEQEE